MASDAAWRKVKPFRDVETARVRYLTIAEAKRLINACSPALRPLVQAALQTGARYSELARLEVRDFNPDAGTLAIRQSKSGKARHIVLTSEGHALFSQLTAGRAGDELIMGRGANRCSSPHGRRGGSGRRSSRASRFTACATHGRRSPL